MYRIAVIGAGRLGIRHLQGLSQIAVPSLLYIVDPAQDKLERARVRLSEMPLNNNICDVVALNDISGLSPHIDLAILATTADVRLSWLECLLAHCAVTYIILEKVLFQREDEYERAGLLLDSHGVRAWVNCPRRVIGIYREVRDYFRDDQLQCMHVQGGDWGLGCNSVHFADLFSFLTGKLVERYDASLLDEGIYPSKRSKFAEVGGTLIGHSGQAQLWLTSTQGSASRLLITARAEKHSCLIDEQAGQVWFLDEKEGWRTTSFTLLYQSQMTGDLALQILQHGTCELPTYPVSAAIHLPFISTLTKHISRSYPNVSACPIT